MARANQEESRTVHEEPGLPRPGYASYHCNQRAPAQEEQVHSRREKLQIHLVVSLSKAVGAPEVLPAGNIRCLDESLASASPQGGSSVFLAFTRRLRKLTSGPAFPGRRGVRPVQLAASLTDTGSLQPPGPGRERVGALRPGIGKGGPEAQHLLEVAGRADRQQPRVVRREQRFHPPLRPQTVPAEDRGPWCAGSAAEP